MFVRKKDEVNAVIEDIDDGIKHELFDYFSFQVKNYKFMPQYRNSHWDGYIRLYNKIKSELYVGLLPRLEEFARNKNYYIDYDRKFEFQEEFSVVEANKFIKSLKLPLEPYDYQVDSLVHSVRNKRQILLSPTSSGKTLLMYMMTEYYRRKNKKILIIIPSVSLIKQTCTEFIKFRIKVRSATVYYGRSI